MVKPLTIRDDIYEKLTAIKNKESDNSAFSYSDTIDYLFDQIEQFAKESQKIVNSLQEATINQEGRFDGSKALAGKKIIYKVKE